LLKINRMHGEKAGLLKQTVNRQGLGFAVEPVDS
jgi:hypothetical protein